jgi:hypothetical protein
LEGGEVHSGFWRRNLRKGGHLDETDVNGRIILKWIFEKWNGVALTGSICLRTWTGGGLL